MTKEHIVRSYDQELTELRDSIVEMGRRAKKQFAKAVESLGNGNATLVGEVIAGDDGVDDLQAHIDGLAFRLLAKRQPLAVDLRIVIASLKIASDLERIADHAVGIARHADAVRIRELEPQVGDIRHMSAIATRMLDDVMASYADHGCARLVPEIWVSDREINRIYWTMLDEIQAGMCNNSAVVNAGTAMIYVSRCCERIGDHVKNVAESIYYMVNGIPYEPPV